MEETKKTEMGEIEMETNSVVADFAETGSFGQTDQTHVLVVDDEPLIRESLAEFLLSRGFLCETAASGKEAVKILESQSFELVVTDMRMPALNGLQLLENLTRKDPDVAILMITEVNQPETAVHAMKRGPCSYL